jgi:hypothetical protein
VILADVGEKVHRQLVRTGTIDAVGEANVLPRTPRLF